MMLKWIKKGEFWLWTLRIVLTAACVLILCFIFSNSLKTGEQSAAQSVAMVDTVQKVASVVAPNSSVATATGAAYDRLHEFIRAAAHFAEFALLGTLLFWCAASYALKKEILLLPLLGVLTVPMIDECLQYFVADRGAELKDVCMDIAGGVFGLLFAVWTVLLGVYIHKKVLKKRKKRGDGLC